MKLRNLVTIGAAVVAISGCWDKGLQEKFDNAVASEQVASMNPKHDFYGVDLTASQENELLERKTLYFGFDNYKLTDDDKLVLAAHAKRLIDNPNAKIRIEGHTDRRGSREYNVALGQKRANAALDILKSKGVPAEQIASVSFGKEKPALLGDTKEVDQMNRRTEIVYEQN